MPENDFLSNRAAAESRRIESVLATTTLDELRSNAMNTPAPRQIRLDGFCMIAEIKPASPAEGTLSDATGNRLLYESMQRAVTYASAGAAAISVLTEQDRFGGSLSLLESIAAACPETPVMRKDFLTHPCGLYEARIAGASGALLITRMLTDKRLSEMLNVANELGLFTLTECFDETDVQRSRSAFDAAQGCAQRILGVNTRDLATLLVDPDRLASLAPSAIRGCACIAESGIATPCDAQRAAELGYAGALVGTALMRSNDPAILLESMRRAGEGVRP